MKNLTDISVEHIGNSIFSIRGERVILDSVLAKLYGVTTARLNQQIVRAFVHLRRILASNAESVLTYALILFDGFEGNQTCLRIEGDAEWE